ncbi:hypothetical protein [Clostridium beijerinckii]|uniref:hypothetical protein n=1 Tax=Clostridium beijerinckii TaxID=1520 RepID=UPI0015702C78|nr:hypothetical protein [Clostridium beijerinckii]NRT74430.1 hypothetical protein [Clostridium beijerinckii]
MALSQNITLNNGLSIENAYIRIDTFSGSKNSVQIVANSYISQESYTNGIGYLEQKIYTFTPDTSDTAKIILKQGYEQLKANVYTTAVDVLEEGQTV